MYFTTNSNIAIIKKLPIGSELYVEDNIELFIQVIIKNLPFNTIINPSTTDSVLINATSTEEGSLTISNIPLQDGVNHITIKKHDVIDADTNTVNVTDWGSVSVMKVSNSLEAEVV